MFDPTSYRDTDFGLDRGESFEPEHADESTPVDLSRPHVMTVLGPIDPGDLGICLTHVSILAGSAEVERAEPLRLRDLRRDAMQQLESFAFAGGHGVLDRTTFDTGRDTSTLYGLAQLVPLHIIASTGRNDLARDSGASDADAITGEILGELREGIDDTPARAGMISAGAIAAIPERTSHTWLRAVSSAHLETGAPISVSVQDPLRANVILDVLDREGVKPRWVIVRHLDEQSSDEPMRELMGRGAWCTFDRIGQGGIAADTKRARRISSLIEAGYGDHILVSPGDARTLGSAGISAPDRFTYLLDTFVLMLMDAGLPAEGVRSLLVDNPRRAISIVPPRRD